MSDPGDTLRFSSNSSIPAGGDFSSCVQLTAAPSDPIQPLLNLSAVNSRMDSLHGFLSDSIARNVLLGSHQMEMVSSEISSAIQQVIINGAALLGFSQIPNPSSQNPNSQIPTPPKFSESNAAVNDSTIEERKVEPLDDELDESEGKIDIDHEVIELDAVEILAEHVHFCEICGKGFKRDANLRMHMRAHGDQFKSPEALAKPPEALAKPPAAAAAEGISNAAGLVGGWKATTRFSCPFAGCNRNQRHKKFKPLKSVICVRNHFKRSHCPKMYSCNRCNKKNFSVLSDLKSHLKNCGESKWRCSCGTTFSRKDKLFGHMALFEGHMPAIGLDDDDKRPKSNGAAFTEDEVVASVAGQGSRQDSVAAAGAGCGVDSELFDDGMFDEFAGINEKYIQEMFGSSSSPDFVQQFFNV